MDRERWKRIETILDRAFDLPEEQRESYLDEACAGDAELRAEIMALLAEDRGTSGPLDATEGVAAALDVAAGDPAGPALPERIGAYRIEQKLDEGGMGIVYRALQQDPKRTVALKVLRAGMDSRVVLARFEAERQALAVMDHPHIAKVFEAGTTNEGLPYFVMEYVDGVPITAYCDRKALSPTARLELFMAVCDAVQHAHRKGIIHRDLKPTNVMVTERDGRAEPKVIDFGIAKAIDRDAALRTAFTEHGQFVGTPEYMSPEQAALTPDVLDTRTDVYSLGVLLYELLTGLLPFEARELRRAGFDEMRRIIRETDPPRPSTRLRTLDEERTSGIGRARGVDAAVLARQLEGELDWIVLRALEKEPALRYGSPEAFAADVRRFLRHEAVEARPASRLYRLRKFARRHRLGVGIAVAALLGVVGFAGAMAWQAARVARERDRADVEARVSSRALAFLREVFEMASPAMARGRTVTARDILDEAAARVETEVDEPRARATIMYTLSSIYRELGVLDRALSLIENTIEIDNELVGEGHQATLRANASLAKTYVAMGRDAEAVDLCRRIEATATRSLGAEHEVTLEAVALQANALNALGHHAEAEPLFRRVYEWELEHRGAESMLTAKAMGNLAGSLIHQGRSEEGEALTKKATEMIEALGGKDHPDTLVARNRLAELLLANGRLDEALAVVRANLESQQRVLGPYHPDTLMSVNNVGGLAGMIGRAAEVEALLEQGLRDAEQHLPAGHWLTHYLRFSYGQCLCFLGRYAEGEPLMLAGFSDLNASRPNDPAIASMKADIATMYGAWGRPDEVAKWASPRP